MVSKKRLPARVLACLLSAAMVPGSLPASIATVYGADTGTVSDGDTETIVDDVVTEELETDTQNDYTDIKFKVTPTSIEGAVGNTGIISVTAPGASADDIDFYEVIITNGDRSVISWPYISKSSNLDKSVDFTLMAEGKTTVTVSLRKYEDASEVCTIATIPVNVTAAEQEQNYSLSGLPATLKAKVGDSDFLSATLLNGSEEVSDAKITYNTGDANVITIDPSTNAYTCVGAGSTNITVTAYVGDSTEPAATATVPVLVTASDAEPKEFTYTIDTLERTYTVGESGSAAGTAKLGTQAVDAAVTYSSSDEAVVKVDEDGNYSCVGAGKATVNAVATYTENGLTYKTTQSIEITVNAKEETPVPVTIALNENTDTKVEVDEGTVYGTDLSTLVTVSTGEAKDILWSSADESIATVADGYVKGVKAGQTTVKAATADGYFVAFTVTVNAVETPAAAELTASKTEFDIDLAEQTKVDLTTFLSLSGADDSDATIAYDTSTEELATVDNGVVTFAGVGTAYVTAAYGDQKILFTFHIKNTTEITADPVTVAYKDSETETSFEVTEGEALETNLQDLIVVKQGDAAVDINTNNLTWSSSDESVAKVNGGVVTGVKAGTAVVTATTKDGSYVTFTVTVKAAETPAAAELTASKTEFDVDLAEQTTVDLTTFLNLLGADDFDQIAYSTSTEELATVDDKGIVTFAGVGTAYVTAAYGQQKILFTFHVTNTTDPDPITIQYNDEAKTSLEVNEGETYETNLLDYIDVLQGGESVGMNNVIWSSSDESIATVDYGVVKGVKAGTATVTAETPDGYYVTFAVKVLAAPELTASETEFDIDLAEQTTADLTTFLSLQGADDSADITYSTSTEALAAVDDKGVVTFAGVGTAYVTAAYGDQRILFTFHIKDTREPDPITVAYSSSEAETSFEVKEGKTLDPNLQDLIEVKQGDTEVDINANNLTWSSSDESIATVNGGVVTGVKAGTAVVTATTKDGYYVTFTVQVVAEAPAVLANVVLTDDAEIITNLTLDSASSASIDLSTSVKSTTVTEADVKTFTWESGDEDIAVVANGTVKAVNPGTTRVTVTAPDGSSVAFIVSVAVGSFTDAQADLDQIVLQLDTTDAESKPLPEVEVDGGKVTWSILDEEIAGIAGNLVTAKKEGQTAAIATAPDGSTIGVSVKVLAAPVLTVEGDDQAINLQMGGTETANLTEGLTLKMVGGLAETTQPITTDLLGQLTWTVSDESVVKVYSGVAVAQSAGTAIVTAIAPNGSSVVFTVTVAPANVSTVALKSDASNIVNLVLGGTEEQSYKDLAELVEDTSALKADPASFTWASEDDSIATVADGVVRAQAKGAARVSVTAPDGSKVTFIVAVSEGTFAETSVDWEAVLQIGGTESKKLPEIKVTAGTITWSSADESIAKINGDEVTAVAPGVTYVIAAAPDGSELAFSVTVYASPSISFDKDEASVYTDETVQAAVNVEPADAQVTYSVKLEGNDATEGTDYLLVKNGKKISFTPKAAGRFVITATADVNGEKAEAQFIVTAQQDVESVAFTESEVSLFTEETEDLEKLIQWNGDNSTPYDTSLTWVSGNTSVATVDATGIVTAVGVGETYVYARAYNGLRAKIKVIVDAKVEGVTLSQDSFELWVGESASLTATPDPSDAKYDSITYEVEGNPTDGENIATVDAEGKIVAVKAGKVNVKATIAWTYAGVKQTSSAKASVLVKAPVESVEIRTVDTDSSETIYSKKRGESIQLKAVITPEDAYDKTVEWSSEDEKVATVDQSGKVTTTGKGSTYIYAKCLSDGYGCDGKGTPAVGMIRIVVGAEDDIDLKISPDRSEVYPGDTVTYSTALTPEEAYEGEVAWTSDSSDVEIDEKGVAKVSKNAQAGLVYITATMTMVDGSTYEDKALLYIKTPVTSLDFEKDAMTIYLNEDDYLTPIFNGGQSEPADTSLTWTSDDASIVSVDQYGKIHAAGLGSTWVSAYAYNGIRAQILVKVIAAPTGIQLDQERISGYVGQRKNISYTFTPEYTTEKDVTWTSTNPDVAYYNTYTNKIVLKGAGSCWITVTANDKHNGTISDKVRVVVKQKVTGVTISKTKLTKKVGNIFKLTATAIPADGVGRTIFWTSSRPQVATVDEFGIVTCLKPGRTTISAITANGHIATCKLTVKAGKKAYTVKYGVTTASALFVRDAASLQGVQLGQLAKGTKVTIVDTVDEWYKIKYGNGYGYVRSYYVELISSAIDKVTAVKSNAEISSTTWIYTGVGTGANTVAPVGTRVLITGATGSYYRIRYGTGSVGSGYVLKSCVTRDSGFKYGVATTTSYTNNGTLGKKVTSTPQVTLYRTARTKKRTGVYADPTGKGKRIGVLYCKAELVLNSGKINGYYQVVFSNGITGYVPASAVKLLSSKVKSYTNTTNTYTLAYGK